MGGSINCKATVEFWFKPPTAGNNLDWVDGKDWNWPQTDPLAGGLRSTVERSERQQIWPFLDDTGLQDPEILTSWYIRLGIHGKHSKGGVGWAY